jgi:hypothetical protein
MWENTVIFRLFSLPFVQSVCRVKTLHGLRGQENDQEAQLAGGHGICFDLNYSFIALNLSAVRGRGFCYLSKVGIFNEPMKLEFGIFCFRV